MITPLFRIVESMHSLDPIELARSMQSPIRCGGLDYDNDRTPVYIIGGQRWRCIGSKHKEDRDGDIICSDAGSIRVIGNQRWLLKK